MRTTKKTDRAEQWTAEHGFDSPSRYRNTRGELLAELLDAEPRVRHSGVVHERWTFEDGSAVVLRFVTWEVEHAGSHHLSPTEFRIGG